MKVLGLIPQSYDQSKVIVEMTPREWAIISNAEGYGNRNQDPVPGSLVEVKDRFEKLMKLEGAVASARKTPTQLRGMADALDDVVDAAKKSITPPPDESVPVNDPPKL
jgi:hypothetical protein